MKRILLPAVVVALTAPAALADFSYQETTKLTGGAMLTMPGAQPPKQQTYATYVKGNRMARIGAERGQITDLDKETVTNINFKNKTYSVITLAQMKAMLAQVSGGKAGDPPVVTTHETGKTRTIGKATAKEMLMTVKVTGSRIDSDVWLEPIVPGYDEVRQFQQRMAGKMGSASAPGLQRTMQEAAKALTKANGIPVLQTSSIHMDRPAGAPGAPDPNQPVMETTTELSGFSSAPVDASKFTVPAGFKQMDANASMPPQRRPAHP